MTACDPVGVSGAAESCASDIAASGSRKITFNATITTADARTLIEGGLVDDFVVVIQLRLGDQLYNTTRGTVTFQ